MNLKKIDFQINFNEQKLIVTRTRQHHKTHFLHKCLAIFLLNGT